MGLVGMSSRSFGAPRRRALDSEGDLTSPLDIFW